MFFQEGYVLIGEVKEGATVANADNDDDYVLIDKIGFENSPYGKYCHIDDKACCLFCHSELPPHDFVKGISKYKGKNYCRDCMEDIKRDNKILEKKDEDLRGWVKELNSGKSD